LNQRLQDIRSRAGNFSLALSQLSYRGVRSENREDCNKAYLLKNLDVLGHILDLQRCDISYDIAGEDAFVDGRQENDGTEKILTNAFLTSFSIRASNHDMFK
jgi:hypothetical protein